MKTSQKSKTRVDYLAFHNNDFAALCGSFFYYKQMLLGPKSTISSGARVSEDWQSTVDY